MGRDGQGCNRLSGCRARTGGCCSRRRKREESEKVAFWLPDGKQRQRIRGRISHLEKKQSTQSLQIRRRGLKSGEKTERINRLRPVRRGLDWKLRSPPMPRRSQRRSQV